MKDRLKAETPFRRWLDSQDIDWEVLDEAGLGWLAYLWSRHPGNQQDPMDMIFVSQCMLKCSQKLVEAGVIPPAFK